MLRAYCIKYIDIQNQEGEMVETHWWLPGRIYIYTHTQNESFEGNALGMIPSLYQIC